MQTSVLSALLLAGLMGMIGQGARVAIGLKKFAEEVKAAPPGEGDAFSAARLLVSLMIGFIAGVLAGLALGLDALVAIDASSIKLLLGLAAAGYGGTDFIEGLFSQLVPTSALPKSLPMISGATVKSLAKGGRSGAQPSSDTPPGPQADQSLSFESVDGSISQDGDISGKVTPQMVSRMFPATPPAHIVQHLPNVLSGLRGIGIGDKSMVLMALGTIRAETEGFVPISEFRSVFNTTRTPFDRYDPGTTIGRTLGNTQPGDGPRFKGRGFVQLTGRDNYSRIAGEIGENLVNNPDLANDSVVAGRILAQFLKDNEVEIRTALAADDLHEARRLVNGGEHGIALFEETYNLGQNILPAV